jgi:transcription antitermination factor NusA-like protein
MKKLLTGLIVLAALGGSVLIADEYDLSVEERFEYLEEELRVMEAKEQDLFDEEEAKAQVAAQNLATLQEMRGQIVSRVNKITAEAKKSMLSAEMKQLGDQYKSQLKQVEDQIKVEQAIVSDWNKLKALRLASIIK